MTDTINIDDIEQGQRLREISEAQVEALVNSISDVGLLNPITVFEKSVIRSGVDADGYGLIAGAHRVEAFKRLGLVDIPAHVVKLSDLERQIAECDENLCGSKLTPSEKAMFVKRRKQAYEALHPETRHGGDRKSDQVAKFATRSGDRFTADTAQKTGQSERVVQLHAERGNRISEGALAALRGTSLDKGTYLDALKMMPEAEQVSKVRADLQSQRVKRVVPVDDNDAFEKQVSALMAAWNKAGREARDEFLARVGRMAA